MKALAVCRHCKPRGVDEPTPAEVEEDGGDLCVAGGGRGASGSQTYMFAVSQLRINTRWTLVN